MNSLNKVLEIVADLIVDAELAGHHAPLRSFDDFVIALSVDSGLPVAEVRSRLVAKMLAGNAGTYYIANSTAIFEKEKKLEGS